MSAFFICDQVVADAPANERRALAFDLLATANYEARRNGFAGARLIAVTLGDRRPDGTQQITLEGAGGDQLATMADWKKVRAVHV